jgi:hypothetical protein
MGGEEMGGGERDQRERRTVTEPFCMELSMKMKQRTREGKSKASGPLKTVDRGNSIRAERLPEERLTWFSAFSAMRSNS